ncbi:hypothetical protein O6H91_Y457000 [Diphasiastrum complanatum]|nr:hypothetical protein O6H91_Y457000 [Diphasiastrum complanatum]
MLGQILDINYDEDDDSKILFKAENKGSFRELCFFESNCNVENCLPSSLSMEIVECIGNDANLIHVFGKYMPHSKQASASVAAVEGDNVESEPRAHRKMSCPKGKGPMAEGVARSSQETNAPEVPGAGLGVGVLNSQQNLIREKIKNERLVSPKTMKLHIKQLERPLIDPVTCTRPLEVRETHDLGSAR